MCLILPAKSISNVGSTSEKRIWTTYICKSRSTEPSISIVLILFKSWIFIFNRCNSALEGYRGFFSGFGYQNSLRSSHEFKGLPCTMSVILVTLSILSLNRRCIHLSAIPKAVNDSVLSYCYFSLFVASSQWHPISQWMYSHQRLSCSRTLWSGSNTHTIHGQQRAISRFLGVVSLHIDL